MCSWRVSWDTLEYLYQMGKIKENHQLFFIISLAVQKLNLTHLPNTQCYYTSSFHSCWHCGRENFQPQIIRKLFPKGRCLAGDNDTCQVCSGDPQQDGHVVFGWTKHQSCSVTYLEVGSQIWHSEPNRCDGKVGAGFLGVDPQRECFGDVYSKHKLLYAYFSSLIHYCATVILYTTKTVIRL